MKRLLTLTLACLVAVACSRQTPQATPGESPDSQVLVAESDDARQGAEAAAGAKWTGDYDGMTERRIIRALVVYNKTNYFIDKGSQHGTSFEAMREFEQVVNKQLGNKTLKVIVVLIPARRDKILQMLADGQGDVALANLTVTPDREKVVDFTNPVISDISELVVTGPESPAVTSIDDLSGKDVYVRKSSSFFEHLSALNDQLSQQGKAPVNIHTVDEQLETEDVLEMVSAGLLPMTIVDSHVASLWSDVLPGIVVHKDVAIHTGGTVAWAIRKDSPKLRQVLDSFIKDHGVGTAFGNTIIKRYLQDNKWVKNATSQEEMQKFNRLVGIFKKRAGEAGFDWLLIGAQAYQESGLDQGVRSPAGAVGVMQIKPSTAASPEVGIQGVETDPDANVRAGVKYLRFMVDHYFKDDPMDALNKQLFAFAAYNAGPARFPAMRKEAADRGLDPNVWFQNVEVIVADRIGNETVNYVSNIYKYYTAYKLVQEIQAGRKAAVQAAGKQ